MRPLKASLRKYCILASCITVLSCLFPFWGKAQQPDSTTRASFWAAVTPTQVTFASPEAVAQFEEVLGRIPMLDRPIDTLCSEGGLSNALLNDYLAWPHHLAKLRYKERGPCVKAFLAEAAKKLPQLPNEAKVLYAIEQTNCFLYYDDVPNAIRSAKEAIQLSDEYNTWEGWAQYIMAKALYAEYKTFDELTLLSESALKWAQAKGDWELELNVLHLMGKVNRDVFFGHTLKAIPYLDKAVAIAEAHQDTIALSAIYALLAFNYEDARMLDKEMAFAQKSLNLLAKSYSPRAHASMLNLLARYYNLAGKAEKTMHFREKALEQTRKTHSKKQLASMLLLSWGLLMEQNKPDEALKMLEEVRALGGLDYEESFYNYYKATGNIPLALQWLEKAYNNSSSHYMNRNALLLSYWETMYRTKEKELDAAQQRKERNSAILMLALVGALLIIIAVFLFFRNKQAKTLAKQNALIEKQSQELMRLDEIKSRFFANVSHELRTPLTLILGPLNHLLKKDSSLNEDAKNSLQLMKQNSQQLLFLVNEILDISKLDADKMTLKEETTAFYPLMRRLVSSFESHAAQLGLKLVFEYRADQNLYLLLDQNLYVKVFYNLLSNALKFTPKGGEITVSILDQAGQMTLKVRDTGRGIHPDDLPNIFDRFYQSKLPNAPIEGGTGIGLAYCAEVARLMLGKVWAESQLGQGTTFHFTFPKKESLGYQAPENSAEDNYPNLDALPFSPAKELSKKGATKQHTASSGLVFVAEDNYSLRDYLQELLSEYFSVKVFPNGLELWNTLISLPPSQYPSIVITDIMMPEMDGYQLLANMKGHEKLLRIPVIVLTAKASSHDRLQALRVGVDDYLLKPFDEEELIARVDGLIANAKLRVERSMLENELPEIHTSEIITSEIITSEIITSEIPKPSISAQQQQEWLTELNNFFEKNLANPDLDAEGIALGMNISRSTLYRQLRDYTGLTPAQYLTECRFNKARYLLENGLVQSVKSLSFEVGYRQVKHFSREYKLRYGKSPSDYLKMENG